MVSGWSGGIGGLVAVALGAGSCLICLLGSGLLGVVLRFSCFGF